MEGRSDPRRWGELFSFYKLVQFFLKKRVNTTPEPVVSTPRAETVRRGEAREIKDTAEREGAREMLFSSWLSGSYRAFRFKSD